MKQITLLNFIIILIFCSCKKEVDNNLLVTDSPFTKQDGRIYGPQNGSLFGFSVAISSDGSIAVVGTPGLNNGLGGVLIYRKNGNTWVLQKTVDNIQNIPHDNRVQDFGEKVIISSDGQTVIFGGKSYNGGSDIACILRKNGNDWIQEGVISVIDASSFSITADGNTIITKGYLDNSLKAISIYSKRAGVWQSTNKFIDSSVNSNAAIIGNIAISGDGSTIVIALRKLRGVFSNIDYEGEINVFTKMGSQWIKQAQSLKPSLQDDLYGFGRSLAISESGNTIVVGTQGKSIAGGAYIFSRNLGLWAQTGSKITADVNSSKINDIGSSVSITQDGYHVIVNGNLIQSADYGGLNLIRKNIVFYFSLESSGWKRIADYIVDDLSTATYIDFEADFANDISITADSKTILVGNAGAKDMNLNWKGHINFFHP